MPHRFLIEQNARFSLSICRRVVGNATSTVSSLQQTHVWKC